MGEWDGCMEWQSGRVSGRDARVCVCVGFVDREGGRGGGRVAGGWVDMLEWRLWRLRGGFFFVMSSWLAGCLKHGVEGLRSLGWGSLVLTAES